MYTTIDLVLKDHFLGLDSVHTQYFQNQKSNFQSLLTIVTEV